MFGLAKQKPALEAIEQLRLDALSDFQILHTEREDEFDGLAHLAAGLFQTPIAIVSLVTRDTQWFKARVGLQSRETPRATSFCTHTIRSDHIMVVPDAHEDDRFASNPLVKGPPFIRFYAGAPLITRSGHRLGSLCIIDTVARPKLSRADRSIMVYLAKLVVKQMEGRLQKLAKEGNMIN